MNLLTLLHLVVIMLENTTEQEFPFSIYRCARPTDPLMELKLINLFAKPGIDILHENLEFIDVAIPYIYIPSFYQLVQDKNGTDLIKKTLINKDVYYGSLPESGKIQLQTFENYYAEQTTVSDNNKGSKMWYRNPFDQFLSYESIVEYLQYLAQFFPQRIRLQALDLTANNRTVFAVIIKSGITNNTAIFIEAGAVARQWITISAALYIIKEIGTNIEAYPGLKNLDWIVMPLVNPDGYEYSYRNQQFRMWTKNRNCHFKCQIGHCGVSIDKNYPYQFGGSGVSYDPCSNMYLGSMPLSEPESQSVLSILQANRDSVKLYIGLRSFGPFILYPWGFIKQVPTDEDDLAELGKIGAEAMYRSHLGRLQNYSVGGFAQIKHQSAGIAMDYVKAVLDIKYTYIIDIRKGANDNKGYKPEVADILPIVEECFQGIKEMADFIYKTYPPPKEHLRTLKNKRRRRSNSAQVIVLSYELIIFVYFINRLL